MYPAFENPLAITHDHQRITNLINFIHMMGDKHDCGALFLEFTNDLEQNAHFG